MIDVRVQQNDGSTLGIYIKPTLNTLVQKAYDCELPLLSGVDYFGITQFNERQVRVIQKELEALVRCEIASVAVDAQGVLALSRLALEGPHRYLIFVGD